MAHLALPEGFISVGTQVPSHSRPVLVIRLASAGTVRFEVLTGRYDPEYGNPWRDLSNDSITESGSCALGWREAPEWLGTR